MAPEDALASLDSMGRLKDPLAVASLFLALLAAMAARPMLVQAPEARPAAEAGAFDAGRAKARLARILGDQRPHPADSEAGDRVRERIVAELRAIGLQPVVRDQFACNELHKARGVSCARVRNVLARMEPDSGPHVLINSHYDSSSVGPGAGDAGAGVATLLEVAAILRSEKLRRPVLFLFNEGEELGLVGARAFLADPISRNVDSLVNLEARGVRGPVHMFETSVPNAAAVSAFARAVDRPVANSLSTDVYRLMPNYTDVNSFAERGWLTLNLAMIGNETRYHSPGDNLDALETSSLQHMGDQALALARELSAGRPSAGDNVVFMDVLGRWLLTLPAWLGLTLLELLLLAFAWTAYRRKALGLGLLTAGTALLGAAALAWLGEAALGLARPGMFWRAYPAWSHAAVSATALLSAVVALRTVGRRLDDRQLRAGFWLLFLVLGTLLVLVAPGGAIYFIFPPLVLFIGIIARRRGRGAEAVAGGMAVLILYLTWGAMLGSLEELLNQGPIWLFAPLGALLLVPALIEARTIVGRVGGRMSAGIAGLLALLGWSAALAAPAYSLDRKQRLTIEYVRDGGRSYWAVATDGRPPLALGDGWKLSKVAYSQARRWVRPTPAEPGIRAPAVELAGSTNAGDRRRVRLRLRTGGSQTVALIAPENAGIRAAGAGNFIRPVQSQGTSGEYLIRCTGRSCDGAVLEIVLGGRAQVPITVVSLTPGLPQSGRVLQERRPKTAQPQYVPDQTVAVTRVKI